MLALPIPLILALVLAFLFVQSRLREPRPWLFSMLLIAAAAQGVVISLVQYYGFSRLHFVQPVMAACNPPLAWLTFRVTAMRPLQPGRDMIHLAAPALAVFSSLVAPDTIDAVVAATFIAYGGLILWELRGGPDGLPLMRLEAGDRPGLTWRAIALALIASAIGDILIAVSLAIGHAWLRPIVISVISSLSLFTVGLLSLAPDARGEPDEDIGTPPRPAPEEEKRDREILGELKQLLEEQKLYLDPDLTLSRLARRMRLPAKTLSAAVNRATGENVSRFINGFRIAHACRELETGASVTAAMLGSGFNTKSNFNREFLRVMGKSPSMWTEAAVKS